jgi:hypothetical protein
VISATLSASFLVPFLLKKLSALPALAGICDSEKVSLSLECETEGVPRSAGLVIILKENVPGLGAEACPAGCVADYEGLALEKTLLCGL